MSSKIRSSGVCMELTIDHNVRKEEYRSSTSCGYGVPNGKLNTSHPPEIKLKTQPSHSYSATSFDAKTPPLKPLDYPTASTSSSQTEDPEQFTPPTTLLPKLFQTLSGRYSTRPGGYTRITKFGRRPGDNAPVAILSLVDGPRDLRFEMTARATGRERAMGEQRELTERNREKVLKFRGEEGRAAFEKKAEEFEVSQFHFCQWEYQTDG